MRLALRNRPIALEQESPKLIMKAAILGCRG